jgi:membrane dipeptidase
VTDRGVPRSRAQGRRRLLQAAVALLATGPLGARAQQPRIPLADMHSHYGMIQRRFASSGFAEELRAERVALVAWKLVADARWIRATNVGIEQAREPAPGELAQFFQASVERMRGYIAEHKLRLVLARADVDACLAGDSGIVLASEGADFLEGRVEDLEAAYARGLRHLQLVHYIRTPVGDFQTVAPVHNGLSEMGRKLVAACNEKGLLVDLLGAEHVAFGTDIEGVGQNWTLNSYGDVRTVVGHLEEMKLPASTIERIAYLNYARVLKASLKG